MSGFQELSFCQEELYSVAGGGPGAANRVPDTAGGTPATVYSFNVGQYNEYKITYIKDEFKEVRRIEKDTGGTRVTTTSSWGTTEQYFR